MTFTKRRNTRVRGMTLFDLVLANGTVIDGTGSPRVRADVGISGDRIEAIGDLSNAQSQERLDCQGLVVSPGFIDIHTHYDAQILWDPSLAPSSWYGVTTAIFGNCSFSIAPTRAAAADRDAALSILEAVEAMSHEVLTAGVTWDFEDFGSYLARLRATKLSINVGAMVGHSMLRSFVLGPGSAFDSAARPDQIQLMRDELRTALNAGAFGFSTSRFPSHVAGGRPIPSRMATLEELEALTDVLGEESAGVFQVIGGPDFGIPDFGEVARRIGRPVTWTSLRTVPTSSRHTEQLAATEAIQDAGVSLWPQMGCHPVTIDFTFAAPYGLLESVPSFGALAGADVATRMKALADRAWVRTAEEEMIANREGRSYEFAWDRILINRSDHAPELEGTSIATLAGDRRQSPLEAMAEVALADTLETRFDFILFDYDEDIVGDMLSRPSVLLGLSDAGAHASYFCNAAYPCHLLGHWVRERQQFSLEFAVWRLTGHPADAMGINDRGKLLAGAYADLCVFDPQTISQGPLERRFDLPASGERLIRESVGVEHVIVNGDFIRREGRSAPAMPGRLISSTTGPRTPS